MKLSAETHSVPLLAWFCRAQAGPKHEHIAAARFAAKRASKFFLPRIRFKKRQRTRPGVGERKRCFPNYLFRRVLTIRESMRPGSPMPQASSTVVHFGIHIPAIPDAVIHEFAARKSGTSELHVLPRGIRAR